MKLYSAVHLAILSLLACGVSGVGYGGYLVNESWPYQFVQVEIDDVEVGRNPVAHVLLNRTKLCPYILEGTIHDSARKKVSDYRLFLSQPAELGDVPPFTVERQMNLGKPNPGPAVDRVRIGSMCNWAQRLFGPNFGPGWIVTHFNFTNPKE